MRNPHIPRQNKQLKQYDTLTPRIKARLKNILSDLTLLTPAKANAKTAKNEGKGYLSYILHLAPASVSGYNMCPAASLGCKAACLNTAGRGRFTDTQNARIRKTLFYVKLNQEFITKLWSELAKIQIKADKLGLTAVVRLNGTSDIAWENKRVDGLNVFETFKNIIFYDYTKLTFRLPILKARAYPNYNLTFSASESNDADWMQALSLGFNVAMVFDKIPEVWNERRVINGDLDDLRFTDAKGVIVGLKAKGKAKQDISGFVKRVSTELTYKQAA